MDKFDYNKEYGPYIMKATDSDFLEFWRQYPLEKHESGSSLVSVGDVPEHILYIESGRIKVVDYSPNGTEVVLNVFASPAFVSLSWLFDPLPNRFYYIAADEVRIRRVPQNEVTAFLETRPELALSILKRLARGLDGIMSRLSLHLTARSSRRLALEIMIEAKRFGKTTKDGTVIKVSVSELAARSGLARETASRQLSQLTARQFIVKNKSLLTIPNLDDLEKFVVS
jgi:CRP-like cAMP-binding protein